MYCPKCGKEITAGSTFCLHCGVQIGGAAAQSPSAKGRNPLLWALVAVLAGAVGLFWYSSTGGDERRETYQQDALRQMVAHPTYVPVVEDIASGSFTLPAGQIHEIRFIVDTDKVRNVRVAGRFSASGGSGNDVQVILADEDNYINWKNGHEANSLYGTGKVTRGTIDVSIPTSGIYYLAFSNAFSGLSSKTVLAEVKLHYEQLGR